MKGYKVNHWYFNDTCRVNLGEIRDICIHPIDEKVFVYFKNVDDKCRRKLCNKNKVFTMAFDDYLSQTKWSK